MVEKNPCVERRWSEILECSTVVYFISKMLNNGPTAVSCVLRQHWTLLSLSLLPQKSSTQIYQLLGAICLHKSLIALGIGLSLGQTRSVKRWLVAVCSLIFAGMSPIGTIIGMILTYAARSGGAEASLGKSFALMSGSLQGMACGTFLYVTFFEVLPREINEATRPRQRAMYLASLIAGFAVMCLFIWWARWSRGPGLTFRRGGQCTLTRVLAWSPGLGARKNWPRDQSGAVPIHLPPSSSILFPFRSLLLLPFPSSCRQPQACRHELAQLVGSPLPFLLFPIIPSSSLTCKILPCVCYFSSCDRRHFWGSFSYFHGGFLWRDRTAKPLNVHVRMPPWRRCIAQLLYSSFFISAVCPILIGSID